MLQEIQAIAELVRCTRGYTIFREGQPPEAAYIVRSGVVKVTRLNPAGRRAVVGIMNPGSILGVLEVLTGGSYETNAEAMEDCELEQIAREGFASVTDRNPSLGLELIRTVNSQLRKFQDDLYGGARKLRSGERLMNVLREFGARYGRPVDNGIQIRVPLTVQDLADKIACSRQWTSKLLSKLQTSGLIEQNHGWIILLGDPQAAESEQPADSLAG